MVFWDKVANPLYEEPSEEPEEILLLDEPEEKEEKPLEINGNNIDYKTMSIKGVKIHYTDDVMDHLGDKMINYLTDNLTEIERLVPSKAWNTMKTIEIYVNDKYSYKGKPAPVPAVSHWSAGWLKANDNIAEKEGSVEIYNMEQLISWSGQQPSCLLHEMAHSFHWRHGPL